MVRPIRLARIIDATWWNVAPGLIRVAILTNMGRIHISLVVHSAIRWDTHTRMTRMDGQTWPSGPTSGAAEA